jgi:hypothetical protein
MNKHSIVLPKRDNNGQREDIALDLLKRIVGDASKKFGGCSVVEGSGYWVMETGELKRDEWFRIEILSGQPDADEFVNVTSNAIKNALDQESVLVTKENCNVRFA